jgi:hypothetical protein
VVKINKMLKNLLIMMCKRSASVFKRSNRFTRYILKHTRVSEIKDWTSIDKTKVMLNFDSYNELVGDLKLIGSSVLERLAMNFKLLDMKTKKFKLFLLDKSISSETNCEELAYDILTSLYSSVWYNKIYKFTVIVVIKKKVVKNVEKDLVNFNKEYVAYLKWSKEEKAQYNILRGNLKWESFNMRTEKEYLANIKKLSITGSKRLLIIRNKEKR